MVRLVPDAYNAKPSETGETTIHAPFAIISAEGTAPRSQNDSFANAIVGDWLYRSSPESSANRSFHIPHSLPSLLLSNDTPGSYAEPSSYRATLSPCQSLEASTALLSPATLPSSDNLSRRSSLSGLTHEHCGTDAESAGKIRKPRSCIECYNGPTYIPSDTPNFCRVCYAKYGTSQYCSGPVDTPCLVDISILSRMAKNLLDLDFPSLHSRLLSPTLCIELSVGRVNHPPGDHAWANFEIDMRQLTNESGFGTYSTLGSFLDLLLPDSVLPPRRTDIPEVFNISALKALSSRFGACMTLLRKQDSTFLDSSLNNDSLAAYIVLDWLRQIVVKASQTFALIYHEIRLFLVAPRSIKGSKQGFAQRRKGVAHILGKIHRTIWTCNVSPARDRPSIQDLGFNLSVTLDHLSFLGKGIDGPAFGDGCKVSVPILRADAIRIFQYSDEFCFQQPVALCNTDVAILDLVAGNPQLLNPAGLALAPDSSSGAQPATSRIDQAALGLSGAMEGDEISSTWGPHISEQTVGALPIPSAKESLEQELSQIEQQSAKIDKRRIEILKLLGRLPPHTELNAHGNFMTAVESGTISPRLLEYNGGSVDAEQIMMTFSADNPGLEFPGNPLEADQSAAANSAYSSRLDRADYEGYDDIYLQGDSTFDPISEPKAILSSPSLSPVSQTSLDYEEIRGSHSAGSQTLVPDLESREHSLKRKPKSALPRQLVKKIRSTILPANPKGDGSSKLCPTPTTSGVARRRRLSSALGHVLGIGHRKATHKDNHNLRNPPPSLPTLAFEGLPKECLATPNPTSPQAIRRVQSDGWGKPISDTVEDTTEYLEKLHLTI